MLLSFIRNAAIRSAAIRSAAIRNAARAAFIGVLFSGSLLAGSLIAAGPSAAQDAPGQNDPGQNAPGQVDPQDDALRQDVRHHGRRHLDPRQDAPGEFDYYVLVLSWSPSFCADSAERNPDRAARNPQCGDRPYSFVVHGLWPQYENGFPEFCQVPAPRLNRNIVSGMLDLMPAPQLVYHEWDRHGVCSGLSPYAYFETIRKARAVVKIPPKFVDLAAELTVSPQDVEDAFIAANPAMKPDGISITCGSRRLGEIRICMTRDLQFRSCEQLERRSCRRDQLVMPPVRGG